MRALVKGLMKSAHFEARELGRTELSISAELAQILKPLVDGHTRAICSCGSGVTACILAFALQRIGFDEVAVYDGSWCEWGLPGELPVVVG